MHRILIADDESSILEAVSFYMEKEGYVALPAKTGTQALELFKREKPSLVVLDVMMPEKNGFEVCKEMRAIDPDVPILFLSAKGDIVDKSVGFSSGADDYITKPFIPDELVMRVNSCLRRRRTEAPVASGDEVRVFGDLEVNVAKREVMRDGQAVRLTAKEFSLLAVMTTYPNMVFTRNQLLQSVWGEEYIGDSGVVAVYVRRVREKIEALPDSPRHLLTDWGVGYRFVP